MNYKIVNIVDNTLVLRDDVNLDEWGNPSTIEFIMDDVEPFKVGDSVVITVVKRTLSE
jgi:hypothetical protein